MKVKKKILFGTSKNLSYHSHREFIEFEFSSVPERKERELDLPKKCFFKF